MPIIFKAVILNFEPKSKFCDATLEMYQESR